MGFILVEGISSYLNSAFAGALSASRLHALAERVASGELASAQQSVAELSRLDASGEVAQAALVHGFGLVMLYGGVCIWLLAAASFVIFGFKKIEVRATATGVTPPSSG
jgi:hypothetical protein